MPRFAFEAPGIELTQSQPDTRQTKANEKKCQNMKNLIAAVGIGAALTTGALAVAAGASASPASFLDSAHVQSYWSTGGDASLLQMGLWVCTQLDTGWTPAAATGALGPGNYFYGNSAMGFVAMAVVHLCPAHSSQDFYESRPLSSYSPYLKRAM